MARVEGDSMILLLPGRRYGKSNLVDEIVREAEEKGYKVHHASPKDSSEQPRVPFMTGSHVSPFFDLFNKSHLRQNAHRSRSVGFSAIFR